MRTAVQLHEVPSSLPDAVLFPAVPARRYWEARLNLLLAQAAEQIVQGPVSPLVRASAGDALSAFDFSTPMDFEWLLNWTIAQLQNGLVQLTHPRYLGLFNPAPSFPAQCADRIVAMFNPQLASVHSSPAAVEIEAHVIRAIGRRAGFAAPVYGHFTSGGSEANYTALICAITETNLQFASIGARAFAGQPVFYISVDSHLAWIKIAHQAGIGRAATRMISTDGTGRLCMAKLRETITADREAGCVPFMLVATAGTTNAGMVDPLQDCADVASREGLWFHADAAWGGAVIAAPDRSSLLAGIERADSVTIDAHKWFATTMGCGMFFTTHTQALANTFNVSASFMPPSVPAEDPYLNSAQWSRRFMGLRLFLSLAAGSWAAHAAHVEHSFELVSLLNETMQSFGWTVANNGALAVTCLEPPSGSLPVRDIVRNVVASGQAWVSGATFEGREVVRACVTHGETTAADIALVAAALEGARC
jgi:aromatic-L-amino-acid decarboxylase